MRFHKKRSVLASAILLASLLASPLWAMPPVVQEVPDDAASVLVVANLKDLTTKLSNTATRLNIPAPPDLLAVMTQQIGITKGLDTNGSAAFITVMPASADPDNPAKPQFVLLLPATDAKQLLEPFKPSAPEKGISTVTLANESEDQGFVSVLGKEGKFVAFAQEKSALELYLNHKNPLTKKLNAETAKAFDNNDLVAYTNVAVIGPTVIKQLDMMQQAMIGMMSMGVRDQNVAASQERIFGLYFDGLKQVFTDANTSLVTFRLGDNGATLGFQGQFKADTPTGKFIAAQKAANPPLLQGLPAGATLAAGDMAWDPPSVANLTGKITSTLVDAPDVAKDPVYEPARKSAINQKQMLEITNGVRFAFYEPPAGSKGYFHGLAVVDTADSTKYMTLLQESAKNNFGSINPANPDIKMTVTTKEKALTINNVSFNEYVLKFSTRPETPDQPLSRESKMGLDVIKKMYGQDGLTIYAGALDKQVIVGYGVDKTMLENGVTAVQQKSTTVAQDAAISQVANQMVPNPSMVLYLPVARWITLAQKQMNPTTAPAGAVVGGEPGAIVVSAGTTGTNATIEVFVPISAMTAISDAIKDAQSAQMGR